MLNTMEKKQQHYRTRLPFRAHSYPQRTNAERVCVWADFLRFQLFYKFSQSTHLTKAKQKPETKEWATFWTVDCADFFHFRFFITWFLPVVVIYLGQLSSLIFRSLCKSKLSTHHTSHHTEAEHENTANASKCEHVSATFLIQTVSKPSAMCIQDTSLYSCSRGWTFLPSTCGEYASLSLIHIEYVHGTMYVTVFGFCGTRFHYKIRYVNAKMNEELGNQ